MTRQNIFTGTTANDGTGDTLRSAGTKINQNFSEIYEFLGTSSDELSSQVSLDDSSVVFEGTTADGFETRLQVIDPSADNLIQLPDSSGVVTLNDGIQDLNNKRITVDRLAARTTILSSNTTIAASAGHQPHVHLMDSGNGVLTMVLADGDVQGELRFITNDADSADFTVSSGDNFTLRTNQGIIVIWMGSQWMQLSRSSTSQHQLL